MEDIDSSVFQTIHEQYNKVKSLQKNDNICTETEPAWCANEAKILLDTMITNIENLLANVGKDHKSFYRLMGMKCTLMYEEAKILVNNENEEQAQEIMAKTLEIMKGHFKKPEMTFLILRIINHYSFLLLKQGELHKPHIMLEDADKLYNELTSKNSSPIFYTDDEIFSPHSTITSKKDTPEKVDRLVTNNLLMLGFVHNKKGNHDKYAYYNHQVLKKQLKIKEFEAPTWAIKAVKLASYLISKHRFREARHHLAAACHILEESERELKQSDPSEANIQKWEELQIRFGDVAKCWVKYGLFLFSVSKSRLVSIFYGESSQFLENLWLNPYEMSIPPEGQTPLQETEAVKQMCTEVVAPNIEKKADDKDIASQSKNSFSSGMINECDGKVDDKLQVATSSDTPEHTGNVEINRNDENADNTETENVENKNNSEEEGIEMSEKGNGRPITNNAIENDKETEIKDFKTEDSNTANEINSDNTTCTISGITVQDFINLHSTQEAKSQTDSTEIMNEKGNIITKNTVQSEEVIEIKDFQIDESENTNSANEINSDNITTYIISGITVQDAFNLHSTQETKSQTDSTEIMNERENGITKNEVQSEEGTEIKVPNTGEFYNTNLANEMNRGGNITTNVINRTTGEDFTNLLNIQGTKDQTNFTQEEQLFFPSLDLSNLENQVAVDLIESAEQARALFLYTHSWLKRFKMCYTLKDNPMEYVNAILDLSELYRYLAFYEEDIESQYSVQKRRADALETLSTVLREVRPECYMAVSIELLRELAEVQLEMMGLNLRRLYVAQESTMPHSHTHATDYTLHKMEALSDIHSRLEQFGDSFGHRADQGDGLSEFAPSEISAESLPHCM